MKLTEKQKNCPYCHLDFEVWTDEYSSGFSYIDSDFPGHWYVETKMYDTHYELRTRTTIFYCPMCGRPLNEEEER